MKSKKTPKDIVHICLNDWYTYEDDRINDFIKRLKDDPDSIKMNVVITFVDMSTFFLITTTKKDLKEQNLEFLMNEIAVSNPQTYPYTQQYYPTYDKSVWCTDDNIKYFDDTDIFYTIYLFIDGLGREVMCNNWPRRLEPYLMGIKKDEPELYNEIKEYYKEHDIVDCDYFNYFTYNKNRTKRNIPVLYNYTVLPKGFIEKVAHKKLDIAGNPIEWTPIPFEELEPYEQYRCNNDNEDDED
jgi:hypothetical protein